MNLVDLAGVPPTPWKNGGGVTRELLAWPQPQDWRVRLSVAEVEADGPFSAFPGVTRWFAVLSGAGVRLDMGAHSHELTAASEPLCFDGAAGVHCSLLGGATQDFNLMLRGVRGRLERVRGTLDKQVDAPALIACYAHSVRARARFGSQEAALAPRTLVWQILDQPSPVRIEGAQALWMEIAL